MPTRCRKKYPLSFVQFSQQSLWISKRNFTNIFNHAMRTYYHQSVSFTLSELQWRRLLIRVCSKTFAEKRIPENRTQNPIWNSCLDFIIEEIWRLNSPVWITTSGKILDRYCTVKNLRYRWTQENVANDSLIWGTIDRAVKEFFKWLNACVVAKDEHFYYSY